MASRARPARSLATSHARPAISCSTSCRNCIPACSAAMPTSRCSTSAPTCRRPGPPVPPSPCCRRSLASRSMRHATASSSIPRCRPGCRTSRCSTCGSAGAISTSGSGARTTPRASRCCAAPHTSWNSSASFPLSHRTEVGKALPMPHMRTADAVIESLIRHGIDTLYALPGVHNDHLFDAAHRAQDRFRVLHPRHEQTAAYMALGAALVTGRPQVFAVVPGPGVLNASAALLTAYGMGAPVIALAGQIPSFAIDRGHGHLHEIRDQLGLLRHITKRAARIRTPHEAPSLVAEAVRIACSGRQQPVALECAIDTWGMTGPVQFPDIVAPVRPPVDVEAVAQAAKILGQAERPLIVVGGGALDAGPEVQAIAEALAAPVSSFRRGRGVIPTTHPLAVSFTEGHALWQHADAVLAIGTRLYQQQSVWGVDDTLPIVRLDIDPAEIDRFRRPACALLGDAATVLRALLAELPAHDHARQRAAELATVRTAFAERLARQEPSMGFLRAIRAALPSDGIYVEEVTQVGFASR